MSWSGRGAGRGGRFGIASGMRPVSELARISIADQLEDFQRSNLTEYTFQPGLSNHDRAVVHNECKKYGFASKSHGKDEDRRVTVYKHQRQHRQRADVYDLPFCDSSLSALERYFEAFPPTETELHAAALGQDTTGASAFGNHEDGSQPAGRHKRKSHKAKEKGAACFSSEQVAAKHTAWAARQQSVAVQPLVASRTALPIAPYREEIVGAVRGHQVVLIAGETGCGKTTQVPQYLLEDAWSTGQPCRIMCTQPRRISAVSIAERVAAERGEQVGDNVGYTIRLESKGGPHCSLIFCTNGVLLRKLTQGEGVQDVTHIVVDEIHERDRFADFLLILLRDILPQQPHLRLILMSATLHIDLFSQYFGGCPVVNVPGFTYPVQDFYLEDVLSMIGYAGQNGLTPSQPASARNGNSRKRRPSAPQVGPETRQRVEEAIMQAFLRGNDEDFEVLLEVTGAASMDEGGEGAPCINVPHDATGATALMAAAGKGRIEDVGVLMANGADLQQTSMDGSTAYDWAVRFGHTEIAELLQAHMEDSERVDALTASAEALSHYQSNTDADEVDLLLIETLLMYICGEGPYSRQEETGVPLGAVLVFMPGWHEIICLKDFLEAKPGFKSSKYQILPLHSMVPAADQRRVFVRPPVGTRKIVLATNIAETAITIDDVVCVINSGRLKEKSYDPYTEVSTLQSAWISAASEKQRRGRAGRCQQGVCFHMYSKQRSEALAAFQLPELKRSPLDEMCLQVKLLDGLAKGRSVAAFLAKAVEPPADAAVNNAVRLLETIGALEEGTEALTVLGRHLAALPLPPRVGKMLLYGLLFGCLDPILTVACSMAYRDPWVLPVDSGARRAATAIKAQMAADAGGCSDHLALVKAYNCWAAARLTGRERQFAAASYVSHATMCMLEGMRSQLLGELQTRGLVTSLQGVSQRAGEASLVRSVLACGFYPQLGHLLPPPAFGAQRKKGTILTGKGEKITIHPASVNSALEVPPPPPGAPRLCPVMIFEEITRGDARMYVQAATAVNPHALILVAAHMRLAQDEDNDNQPAPEGGEPDEAILVLDEWLHLRVPLLGVGPMAVLRQRIGAAFAAKVQHPTSPLAPHMQGALETAAQVFVMEAGGSGTGSLAGASHQHSNGNGRGGFGRGALGGRGFGSFGGRGQVVGGGGRGPPIGGGGRGRGRTAAVQGSGDNWQQGQNRAAAPHNSGAAADPFRNAGVWSEKEWEVRAPPVSLEVVSSSASTVIIKEGQLGGLW
ncbi:hypothetical protein WJX72_010718 [[Myrmecia] bisecta]|uniref:RNA helicase n=1 Tax=[Myrmecia] bisecta TaxID=41462 RepID=A0AAW1PY50_9CHLO